jgi:hypothetical protein
MGYYVPLADKDESRLGWTLSIAAIESVRAQAGNMADVSSEEVEAVMCAMIDLGYSLVDPDHAGDFHA